MKPVWKVCPSRTTTKLQLVGIEPLKHKMALWVRRYLGQKWIFWYASRFMSSAQPKKTCLYDFHVAQKGKIVDFAGYLLPIQYGKEGIAASHLHTR